MNITVSCSPQFVKQLSALEKAGGKAALAAKQAERILDRLARPVTQSLFLKSKQTKSGEKRLKNIEKYDLGAGYRLICRREGGNLLLEFIGTHDKSDHWLNRNRTGKFAAAENRPDCLLNPSHEHSAAPVTTESGTICPEDEDSYEDQLMQRIDEKMLNRIFCGFFEQPRQNND